ncbi:MAG: hypothetical protein LBI53_08400 [Candidatus Peribacteria bacterium]|nr:hypothetical protein [Candidatus Peribacteria bacterium]
MDINLSVSDLLATYKQTKDQNSQFKKSYNSSFNADPYSVALGRVKAKGNTLLLGGVSEVSAKLQEKNCPLSQKDISTILYYFDPDFRSAMVADLSLSTNQYLDKVPSLAAVKKSCGSFIQGCYPGH